MRLTLVNLSTRITMTQFRAVRAALSKQVNRHFKPEWGGGATLTAVRAAMTPKGKVAIEGVHDAMIYVGDAALDPTSGVSGALGYHSRNHRDTPYGFVYLDVCAKYGENWTCTLSHEVLELLADPDAVLTVNGPDPRNPKRSVHFDLEVCDPTQADTYDIDGITVSNFVTRKYFGMTGSSAKTNHLGLPLKAFGVRRGGYFQYEDGSGAHQINGRRTKKAAQARAEGRSMMRQGRRNTRRSERATA
jgi:hypothetical protein